MEERITQKKLQSMRTQELLRAAISKVITEKGIDQFTVKDVCTEANVAIGTFYKYYVSKEDVIRDRYIQIDEFFSNEVAPRLTDTNELENLVCFARMYFIYCQRTPLALGRQVLRARLNGVVNQPAVSRNRPFFVLLDSIFTRGQAKGFFRKDVSVTQLSDQFMILLRGYSFNHAVSGSMAPEGQSAEGHIRLWCTALLEKTGK